VLLVLAALALFLAACGGSSGNASSGPSTAADQPGTGKPAITIGTKDFTEEFVLGELYAQALRAKGWTVDVESNIGPTEITDKALTAGRIDAYPEYSGESLATVAGRDVLAKSAQETAAMAKAFYARRGQVVSDPTPFENVDAVAATNAYARANDLTTMDDLRRLRRFTIGARPEFKNRFVGLAGMEKVYGIDNARFRQVAVGLQYQALDNGDVDTANVFTTDAQLASGRYTVLKDPKGVFGFQNVLFVMNKRRYDRVGGPQLMAVVNQVNALLTAPAMRTMNAAVALDKKAPKDVAGQFLRAHGMLGGGGG
jgi:osmoprotectant transport system substrate-binding protein